MGGFDWIIAAIFLVSIIVGLMRGFAKEALSIASWMVSIWLAFTFCTEAGEFINQYIRIPNPSFRDWAGFALIFIGGLIIFALISYAIVKLLIRGPIKGVDRILGLGFGAIRAAAIMVAVVIVGRGAALEEREWWKNSSQIGYFESMADSVEHLLPESWKAQTEEERNNAKVVADILAEKVSESTKEAEE
ncbi:CvpA family protein [Arenicella xantha]|uniref:Membrane protein required for colicin V production n=1 Tax=Arenicella xantha TaxID=644221 RepID=A0A395JJL4_9GAMM|nr:CvpA family protein [Arenicella xantha]RBP50973.1 membrane protein required for colicin V production [Arenicella xantha]